MKFLGSLGQLLTVAAIAALTSVAALPSASDAQAQTAKQRSVQPKGILKKPSPGRRIKLGGGKQKVRFNLKARKPGPGYRNPKVRHRSAKGPSTRSLLNKRGQSALKARQIRNTRSAVRGGRAASNAAKARRIRNTAKAAKLARGAKYLAAGTGVVAVVGIAAGAAGVDPVEMATLKATNPAEYQRRMQALKKNPLKYMGNNVKNNTAKVGRGIGKGARAVGQGTKKVGQGIGRGAKKFGNGVKKVFAKRKNKR